MLMLKFGSLKSWRLAMQDQYRVKLTRMRVDAGELEWGSYELSCTCKQAAGEFQGLHWRFGCFKLTCNIFTSLKYVTVMRRHWIRAIRLRMQIGGMRLPATEGRHPRPGAIPHKLVLRQDWLLGFLKPQRRLDSRPQSIMGKSV